MKNKKLLYHLVALLTGVIWGTTFVTTKISINNGLTPIEIFLYRFILAYVCILFISHRKLWADNWKDELLLLATGVCGGSLYFITENMALGLTKASNVSLIICTTPIITSFISLVYKKEPFKQKTLYGSLIALAGVALIVFNGNFDFEIMPMGDFLTLIAATSWAFYCLLLKKLDTRYSTLFITRKMFFYGIISLLVFLLFYPTTLHIDALLTPFNLVNLLFLGIVASLLCFILWNLAVKELGAVQASNYIYIIPLVTMITSAIVLNEAITLISLAGSACIVGGVYLAERH